MPSEIVVALAGAFGAVDIIGRSAAVAAICHGHAILQYIQWTIINERNGVTRPHCRL
jgi:hypothetical protein